MLSEDSRIWDAWLEQHSDLVRSCWYDIHVGTPMALPADLPEWAVRDVAAISRKRIDVVWLGLTNYHVTEVKPYASYTALGQVLLYERLFRRDYGVVEAVRPTIICDRIDPDIIDDLERYSVMVWVVGS
jgi:hypothetical protein